MSCGAMFPDSEPKSAAGVLGAPRATVRAYGAAKLPPAQHLKASSPSPDKPQTCAAGVAAANA